MKRSDPILPNAAIVARREYAERVRSRLFHVSTLVLALLAIVVALLPLAARIIDQPTTSRVGIVADEAALAEQSTTLVEQFLNSGAIADDGPPVFAFEAVRNETVAATLVDEGELDAALIVDRTAGGGLRFRLLAGATIPDDRSQLLSSVGTFAFSILDWTANNGRPGADQFLFPGVETRRAGGATTSGEVVSNAEFAGRRIVAIVLVVLIFITLIIYGMWVAAGVVGEKTSRVMEVMISAASPPQLVLGKVAGIGLAGLTQAALVLGPALAIIAVEDQLATALLGPGPSIAPSLAGLSPVVLGAFVVYFVLGFVLYGLVYAAAGSLVSRAEDLQMLALPLSLIAIAGYLQAILALTGGNPGFIRIGSLVPFWSPFVMLTRIAVGRATLLEVVLSVVLLLIAIGLTYVVAIRVYAAGVLLYGQRPGLRQILGAMAGSRQVVVRPER